jgi:hypothetical protein
MVRYRTICTSWLVAGHVTYLSQLDAELALKTISRACPVTAPFTTAAPCNTTGQFYDIQCDKARRVTSLYDACTVLGPCPVFEVCCQHPPHSGIDTQDPGVWKPAVITGQCAFSMSDSSPPQIDPAAEVVGPSYPCLTCLPCESTFYCACIHVCYYQCKQYLHAWYLLCNPLHVVWFLMYTIPAITHM